MLQSLEDEAVAAAIPSLRSPGAADAAGPAPAPADKDGGKADKSAKAEQGGSS